MYCPSRLLKKAVKKKSFRVVRLHTYVSYDYMIVSAASAKEARKIAERDENELKWIDEIGIEWDKTKFLTVENAD